MLTVDRIMSILLWGKIFREILALPPPFPKKPPFLPMNTIYLTDISILDVMFFRGAPTAIHFSGTVIISGVI